MTGETQTDTGHRLVLVAHGTRNVDGNQVSRAVAEAASRRLGLPAMASFVELSEPLFSEVMEDADRPVIVVPMLLSTGFHVRSDLPEAIARATVPVTLGRTLGPDPLLAQAQVDRLLEAGAERGQRVVLVAAGSSDEAARCDQMGAVSLLARAWDGPVELATLSGHGTRPDEIVRPGDAVSPYLLSPGHFADRIGRLDVPDTVVAEAIGPHPLVVDLVVQRVEEMLADEGAE